MPAKKSLQTETPNISKTISTRKDRQAAPGNSKWFYQDVANRTAPILLAIYKDALLPRWKRQGITDVIISGHDELMEKSLGRIRQTLRTWRDASLVKSDGKHQTRTLYCIGKEGYKILEEYYPGKDFSPSHTATDLPPPPASVTV